MNATVVYNNALAYYSLTCIRPGVYGAVLSRYDGAAAPPAELTLIRSENGWTSSGDHSVLARDLGNCIDRQQNIDHLFPQHGDDAPLLDNLV